MTNAEFLSATDSFIDLSQRPFVKSNSFFNQPFSPVNGFLNPEQDFTTVLEFWLTEQGHLASSDSLLDETIDGVVPSSGDRLLNKSNQRFTGRANNRLTPDAIAVQKKGERINVKGRKQRIKGTPDDDVLDASKGKGNNHLNGGKGNDRLLGPQERYAAGQGWR